jgi:hypothetical protein
MGGLLQYLFEDKVMKRQNKSESLPPKVTVKLEPDVHAWLLLLSEKYNTTISGALHKLITEHEPEVVKVQSEIDALKKQRLLGEKES